MIIEYIDKPEKADPAKQVRCLIIHFDEDEEIEALNKRDTYKRVLKYTRLVMNAFLELN